MITRLGITACAIAAVAFATGADAATEKKSNAPADSSMTLPGGSEGKTLESITVEGEDRVRVQFERPPLDLSLDPSTAPGLDWESLWTVLAPESFDFTGPLFARSAFDRAWFAPRPWLETFRSGPVARFRPAVSGVEKWTLEVADSRGGRVARFDGSGKPPKEIAWDGTTTGGGLARADLTYSYVLNAMDKAGNKRSFVGEAFSIPPQLNEKGADVRMSFAVALGADAVPESYLMEAASRINESGSANRPVRVEVTAPTFASAKSIADEIAGTLKPLLRGDASRIMATTTVDAGGGERAAVVIQTGAAASTAPATKKQG
ncbi:MAG TPA: hypothetical protein VFT13_13440 [Candidatus Krumholzibacteria bacterium]|nr:hypothetical protein [Candidatus Krumholzibacteria bacterium]